MNIFQNLHQFTKIISTKNALANLFSAMFSGTLGTFASPSGWNLGNCLTSIWQIFSLWSPCSCTTCRWVYSSSIFHQMETTVVSMFVWNNFFHTPVMHIHYPVWQFVFDSLKVFDVQSRSIFHFTSPYSGCSTTVPLHANSFFATFTIFLKSYSAERPFKSKLDSLIWFSRQKFGQETWNHWTYFHV